MKKYFLILFIILGVTPVFSLFCQSPGGEKSFLWRLDYDSNHSYILGSIHFLKKSMYPLKPVIEEAFREAQVLAVEADISAARMADHLKMTMEKSRYPGEDTLEKNLSPETFDLAKKTLQKFGIDIQFYRKFKPWFLALTVSGLEVMKLGYDPNFGVDKYFIDRAYLGNASEGSVKKEIYELEGIEYQINLFEAFTSRESEIFLLATLQEVAGYETGIDDMVSAWLTGDIATLDRILKLSVSGVPELNPVYDKIIDKRNRQMAEQVLGCLKTGKIHFIVVGAAHLVGKNGMIWLLADRGVTVKQI